MSNQGLTPIIIDSISIKQDIQGRFCLNDLHKAAGGDPLQRPQLWLRNKQTQDLISEISSAQICAVQENQALRVINGGPERGTYACEELVYAYAMWISPSFHLKVIRTFKAVVKGELKVPQLPNFSNPAEAARAWADEYDGRLLAENKVTELQPKANFVDLYVEAQGTESLEETGKLLGLRPRKFIQRLREDKILRHNAKGQNIPYQPYLEREYFTVKTSISRERSMTYQHTRVTAKGREWLAEKYSYLKGKL